MTDRHAQVDTSLETSAVYIFATGLLTALAVASLGAELGEASGTVAVAGVLAVISVCLALAARDRSLASGKLVSKPLMTITELVCGIVGVAASLPAVVLLLSPEGIPDAIGLPLRYAVIGVAVLAMVAGFIVAVLVNGRKITAFPTGLAGYGVVEALVFFVTPGGADILGLGSSTFLVSLCAALFLGFLLGLIPRIVLLLTAASTTFIAALSPGSRLAEQNAFSSAITYIVVFFLSYALLRFLARVTRIAP